MKITISTDSPVSANVDLLVVGVGQNKPSQNPLVKQLDRAMSGALLPLMRDEGFKGRKGQSLRTRSQGRLKAKRIMLVGLGEGELDEAAKRLLAVRAGRAAARKGSVALVMPDGERQSFATLAEGLVTGAYIFTRYLTGDRLPKKQLKRAVLLAADKPSAEDRAAVSAGLGVGEAVNMARDLVNMPANDLTATDLANLAAERSKAAGIACTIYGKKAIEKLGMPLLLAVNRGSTEEPRFIHMTYTPKTQPQRKVVFVGKGLTFDSGGLCIKPAQAMEGMKMDMAGSATTIATVLAAAHLELPIEVHGIVASTDNMTGGNAYRPGDVFPSRDGKTVEIINTDAEGRLVLADALAFARELEPDYLIDHATLTGACMVALGDYRAGLYANDDELLSTYQDAATDSGEDLWHMPLDENLREQLKSSIADLKHVGTRMGGSITAALFLSEFIGDCRWAHLDIAGPAMLSKVHGIHPKGGTGFGVLTAVNFLKRLASPEAASE
ncbi:MAG: leucyl aminopeptidase [Myxococcales bacterium]|jgi:leucyl aminopeptidase